MIVGEHPSSSSLELHRLLGFAVDIQPSLEEETDRITPTRNSRQQILDLLEARTVIKKVIFAFAPVFVVSGAAYGVV